MRDAFSDCHPAVNFLYFTLVLGFTMILDHPVAQAVSFVCAIWYAVQCEGKQAVRFTLKACVPMIFLTAFINPAFSHEGVTILLYFPTGNPLTLESLLYGISAGVLLGSVLMWFVNFNRVITSDKFIYLFGRIIPALSLILSMTLRFIPKFRQQMAVVTEAQAGIGNDVSSGSVFHRMKIALTIVSIMITWSLENAIDTADSMKSRGYGLKGRTAFSIYKMEERDRMLIGWFLFSGVYLITGTISFAFGFRYFPSIRYVGINWITGSFYVMYLMLCMSPMLINLLEERKWKSSHADM